MRPMIVTAVALITLITVVGGVGADDVVTHVGGHLYVGRHDTYKITSSGVAIDMDRPGDTVAMDLGHDRYLVPDPPQTQSARTT